MKLGSKTRTARPALPKLSGGWALFTRSWRDLLKEWKLYLGIVALVALPSNILTTYFASSSAGTLQAYLTIAGLFMNVALIYTIVRLHRERQTIGIRTAYYSGSHAVLRFVVVTLLLAAMLLPLTIASEIYGVGLSGVTAAAPGELGLLGLIGLPFVLLSLWLMARSVLSLIAVVDHDERPVSAVRLSWRLTRGRFWPVLGRELLVLVWLLMVLAVPVVALAGLFAVSHNLVFLMLVQLVVSLIGLPLVALYGFHLYDELQLQTESV